MNLTRSDEIFATLLRRYHHRGYSLLRALLTVLMTVYTWDILVLALMGCMPPASCSATFSPKTGEELKVAVDTCLRLSPVGDYSTWMYGPIRNYNVSQVTDMHKMFSGAEYFDQDLYKWNVGKVTD